LLGVRDRLSPSTQFLEEVQKSADSGNFRAVESGPVGIESTGKLYPKNVNYPNSVEQMGESCLEHEIYGEMARYQGALEAVGRQRGKAIDSCQEPQRRLYDSEFWLLDRLV
jgi:hypothetical protein